MTSRRQALMFRCLILVAWCVAGSAPCLAQDLVPPAGPVAAPAPGDIPIAPIVPVNVEHLAADALARATLLWLRDLTEPGAEEYRVAALNLRLAQRLRPDDEELLRLEFQAWNAAGDDARTIETAQRIVRLAPDDTVIQLRLITSKLQSLQNAELRLAAYDRLIGEGGRSLDASIRSRLALDAALLAHETGDEDGFVQRLTAATELDSTNKEAAALHCTYFLDRTADPRERADLLANVLLADPNDPSAHANLSHELFRQRVFAGSYRFLQRAGDILGSAGVEPGVDDLFDRYLLVWMGYGDDACMNAIINLRNKALSIQFEDRKRLERQGLDPGPPPEPLVPGVIENISQGIAFANGLKDFEALSVRRIKDRLDLQLDALHNNQAPYENVPPEEAAIYERDAKLDLTVSRLWAGVGLTEAEADLNTLIDSAGATPLESGAARRFRGLLALHKGRFIEQLGGLNPGLSPAPFRAERDRYYAEAESLLAPVADRDGLARLGMGMLAEARADKNGAWRHYALLAHKHPTTVFGCAARRRLEILMGKKLAPSKVEAELERWAANLAPWLDEMTTNPSAFMTLTAQHQKTPVDTFERQILRVTLKNVSRLPMALGPEHSFNSRLLLTSRVVVRGADLSARIAPEPIELDRRLRLMPGESVSADVWTTRGPLGLYMDLYACDFVAARWRALQGYRIDHENRFAPGAISVTAESDNLVRNSIGPMHDTQTILSTLETAQGRALIEEILRVMINAVNTTPSEDAGAKLARRVSLAEGLAAQFHRLSDFEKTHAICTVVRGSLFIVSDAITRAAEESTSPYVRAALMLVAIKSPDHPALARYAEDSDADIRDLAKLTRARLRRHAPTEQESK